MTLKTLSTLLIIALLTGCASKITPYNPQAGDNLRSYAKSLAETNKYHINAALNASGGAHDGYRTLSLNSSFHMPGNTFTQAMTDACKTEGGIAEKLGGVYNTFETPHGKLGTFYGFICRVSGQHATLVKVQNVHPYNLGYAYSIHIMEHSDASHDFSRHTTE